MLGLPDGITACLFDLDGVLTKTAVVHERAWKVMFDEFLGDRGTFEESDYNDYVDGNRGSDTIKGDESAVVERVRFDQVGRPEEWGTIVAMVVHR